MSRLPRKRVAFLALLLGVSLLVPATQSPALEGDDGRPADLLRRGDVVPPELIEELSDCPAPDAYPPDSTLMWCIKAEAYDGEIKLGDTTARVNDPIEITVGIGGSPAEPVIILPEDDGPEEREASGPLGVPVLDSLLAPLLGGGGHAGDVNIPGGILGLPVLDPVIELEPLGLLALSATPELGEGLDADACFAIPDFCGTDELALDLSIQLHNLLLGDDCRIASPAKPIEINLTTGTTALPDGVEANGWEPMSGEKGGTLVDAWHNYGGLGLTSNSPLQRNTSRFVSNTFAVPGADGCGPNGVFNGLVNSQAGLPAPVGSNHVAFTIDRHWADEELVRIIHGDELDWTASPAWLDFGKVDVGESLTRTLTVENARQEPLTLEPEVAFRNHGQTPDGDQFEVMENGCGGVTLQTGEQCTIDVRFAPTSVGLKHTTFTQRTGGLDLLFWSIGFWEGFGDGGFSLAVSFLGTGVALQSSHEALDFGAIEVGTSSEVRTVKFENVGSLPRALDTAVLDGSGSASWVLENDSCSGQTVGPGGTCSIDIQLTPDSAGGRNVTLRLPGDGSAALGRVELRGSGAHSLSVMTPDGPPLGAGVGALAFGEVIVGESSPAQTARYVNTGTQTVPVSEGVALNGTASRFSSWDISDGCAGLTLAPGDSCDVEVRLAPDSAGNKTVNLRLLGDGASIVAPQFQIQGTGVNP